jgi:hypothetical protein
MWYFVPDRHIYEVLEISNVHVEDQNIYFASIGIDLRIAILWRHCNATPIQMWNLALWRWASGRPQV